MIGASRKVTVWVGLFVVVMGTLAALILIFLGAFTRLLSHDAELRARFADVSGLKKGASVVVAGVPVGTVEKVQLAPTGTGAISILHVDRKVAARMRKDATVRLASAGFIGDKSVVLELGQAAAPWPHGAELEGTGSSGTGEVIAEAKHAVESGERLLDHADRTLTNVFTPEMVTDLRQTVAELRQVSVHLARGPGVLHELTSDSKLGNRVRASADNAADATHALDEAARKIDRATGQVNEIVNHVHEGRGTIGGLVYDPMIYENLRTITGDVRRSFLLRELVRFAIKHEENKREEPQPPPVREDKKSNRAKR